MAPPVRVSRGMSGYDPDDQRTCAGCGERIPAWPTGWLATEDERVWCPACRVNVVALPQRPATGLRGTD